MITFNASDARGRLADLLNRVAYGRERIRIERRGKVLAVLVSPEDAELLEAIEDEVDAMEIERALREHRESGEESIPYDVIRKNLDLA